MHCADEPLKNSLPPSLAHAASHLAATSLARSARSAMMYSSHMLYAAALATPDCVLVSTRAVGLGAASASSSSPSTGMASVEVETIERTLR